MFSFQIAQELFPFAMPMAPLTQIEFVRKKTKKSAKSESEPESPIRRSGCPPTAEYAIIASASDSAFWVLLKTVFRSVLRAKTWAASDARAMATTLTQCGAIAALANTGMNESEPDASLPVRYLSA